MLKKKMRRRIGPRNSDLTRVDVSTERSLKLDATVSQPLKEFKSAKNVRLVRYHKCFITATLYIEKLFTLTHMSQKRKKERQKRASAAMFKQDPPVSVK